MRCRSYKNNRRPVRVSENRFRCFAELSANIRAALDAEVPWGYQDENGFHFGVQPILGKPSIRPLA
jgi:hypothetical protein